MKCLWRVLLLSLVLVRLTFAQASAVGTQTSAMAIWPFEVVAMGVPGTPEDMHLIREVLPDLLAAELLASPRIRLVERQRLNDVLQEQRLSASALADEATRLRLGRLSGARWMLFGNHLRIGSTWQLDARLVDVETSQVVTSFTENGQHSDYLALTRRMARHLLQAMP
jgi:hypothetical protein